MQRLTREGVFIDISFEVKAGEIVALAGLVGSGRSEVARAIFGVDKYDAGGVLIDGQPLRKAAPAAAMAAGIGYVPEDRRQQGLVMEMSIQQNVGLASLHRLQRRGLISSASERSFASDWAQRLSLKYGRLTDPVSKLSGGNQQKVVLAKWLGRQPEVLIVDEPTRGIDIGTKAEVHRLLVQLAADRGRRLDDLLRATRGSGDRRPDPGHARRPADRRVRLRRRQRGVDHGRRDRPIRRAGLVSAALDRARPARGGAPAGTARGGSTERVFRIRESGILAVLIVFVAVTTIVQHRFLAPTSRSC